MSSLPPDAPEEREDEEEDEDGEGTRKWSYGARSSDRLKVSRYLWINHVLVAVCER